MRTALVAVLVGPLLTGCGLLPGSGGPDVDAETVRATFRNAAGESLGQATLRSGAAGVLIRLELRGLTVGTHALHIHETGSCTPDFTAAGDHFNPGGKAHGILHPEGMHAGDLPNLIVTDNGTVSAELFAIGVSLRGGEAPLLGGDGSALVIHENYDDYLTQPTGGSGDRIACAVIGS